MLQAALERGGGSSVPLEQAWASRSSYGAPDWQVEAWISTYTAIAKGELATVSDTVRRFTGRDPLTLADLS